MSTFIETQFPIARLSAESYKERKAVSGQTLTGLGKWWGRKPLILVRASILGMLMPASSDHKRDREIFLKILTMDDDGAWQRCKGDIPAAAWRDAAQPDIQAGYFSARGFKNGMSDEEKAEVCGQIWDALDPAQREKLDARRRRPVPDRSEFDALPYAQRIVHCERPEHVGGPSPAVWDEINAHLGTSAGSLPELVKELGMRTYGRVPRVGDSFCGGGSIPFEAARIGCEAFGSDLNPVAGLMSWANLNLLGGGASLQREVRQQQAEVFHAADLQVAEWGIEHNDAGERAEAFLYCVEVKPEGCDYFIPLAPSWIVDEYSGAVVRWHRRAGSDRLDPEIVVLPAAELDISKKTGRTVVDSRVVDPFDPTQSWSITALRGPHGLRRWSNDDVVPRPDDVFQERLYCIRWMGKDGIRRYASPNAEDLQREATVLELLRVRFAQWQYEGYIPSKAIPIGGDKTEEPIRTRGWTHWHHLFTPRQLLIHGLLASLSVQRQDQRLIVAAMLSIGRMSDWNSRLSCWLSSKTQIAGGKNTFLNQALNPLFNYATRPLRFLESAQISLSKQAYAGGKGSIAIVDARDLSAECDLWLTDPPYADAVNYHELADFFLAWYDKPLGKAFPDWMPDGRAELAVRGDGVNFRRSMVEIYSNLARQMPDNGLQMVMFTHQNPAVWADLGMILWAAGLKATAAWTISTETESAGIKKGNYVQGTVCLVLRKRLNNEPGFLDEVYPLVEDEVKRQIASMQALDESGEPNFNDADYQLAAYAAALKVLTHYGTLDGRDVEHEVFATREHHAKSDFQVVIERALRIACDTLIPRGLEVVWRDLPLVDRYYLRSLDIESRGERRKGMYEELARGFGVTDIRPLLKSDKANGARMLTPSGLAASLLGALARAGEQADVADAQSSRTTNGAVHPFSGTALRHLMFSIRETVVTDNSPEAGRQYLRDTFGQGYWGQREYFIGLLEWLAALGNAEGMSEWTGDSEAARILAGRLRNDHA